MAMQVKSPLRLEIGHVLFIDIVGYSALLLNEQSGLFAELNEVVRGTERFRSAEADSKFVRLPTGDGMALVFHNSPEEPARCALEISQALKEHPKLRVAPSSAVRVSGPNQTRILKKPQRSIRRTQSS